MTFLGIQANTTAVWLILVVAIIAYGLLFDLWLDSGSQNHKQRRFREWAPCIRTLLSALPLLGLFGTVVGLMQTFRQMAAEHGFDPETLATGGIAAAMYSTQLGLLMMIPGWLLLSMLAGQRRAERTPS
ncbi:MAG: MotA/TolQ/ExbB proton channel family protein [Pseudomonadota bacterium]